MPVSHSNEYMCPSKSTSVLCSPQGVAVDVLGVFYILQKHSGEVNRDMVVPRFHLSERVARAQGLSYTNSDIPGMPRAQSLCGTVRLMSHCPPDAVPLLLFSR